jgi:hypothetical protein
MATKGLLLVAGLSAVTACAAVDGSEPETKSVSSAYNANPVATAGTSLAANHQHSFGASCALWDTGRSRDLVLTAFGYKGTAPTYLNTYDLFDPGTSTWGAGGTVQDAGPTNTATAAAYVSAVNDPTAVSSGHLTTCVFAGGFDGTNVLSQVWKATVANGVVTWTKLTSMNVARARFGLSWGGSTTKKLIAVGGGFGTTRTNTIETFNLATPGTWTTETPTLDQAVHSFGFQKISDTKFVTAGGNGATNNPSAHINAIKVNANGGVDSVGDIKNGVNTVIDARKDNIVVPTGKTGLSGTDPVEIMVAMGQDSTPNLVTSTRRVVIAWNSGTTAPSHVSNAAGSNPSNNVAFPTIVDGSSASSNPGYMVVSGINAASPQLSVNTIQKWNTSSAGGSWGTATTFAAQNRTGTNAVYVTSIDKTFAAGGTDRYPASASSTDYLNMDEIQ